MTSVRFFNAFIVLVSNLVTYQVTKFIVHDALRGSSELSLNSQKRLLQEEATCCDCHAPNEVPSQLPSRFPTQVPVQASSQTPSQASSQISSSTKSNNTIFFAIADVPYNAGQSIKLTQQVKNIPPDALFLIHLGDIKPGAGGRCEPEDFESVAEILRMSTIPVMIIPGDNEWNDCTNTSQAWSYWKASFQGFENHWNHSFAIDRPHDQPENFRFVWNDSLFIGLNLVGGRVHNSTEWNVRLTKQVEWVIQSMTQFHVKSVVLMGHANPRLAHDDFFQPLKAFLRDEFSTDVEVLYVHGDGHSWQVQPAYLDQPMLLRIQLEGGASQPPLKFEIENLGNTPESVFLYDRGF